MEISRILIGSLFVVVGFVLARWVVSTKLQLEKEVKPERSINMQKILPYWNGDDFTDKGNSLRKTYNNLYYALIVYTLALYAFMHSGE